MAQIFPAAPIATMRPYVVEEMTASLTAIDDKIDLYRQSVGQVTEGNDA